MIVFVALIIGFSKGPTINPANKVFDNQVACLSFTERFKKEYKEEYDSIFTQCSREEIRSR